MKLIDLTHEITTGMQAYPGDPEIGVEEYLNHENDYCHVDRLLLGSHSGTHIDAPYHFISDGKRITDYPLEKFAGKGIVMDFSYKKENEAITADEIRKYSNAMQDGYNVIIKTGWHKKFDTDEYIKHPYISGDAAKELVEMGISIIAVDFLNVDPTGWESWEAHPEFLSNDVLIVENLNNTEILEDRHEYYAYFMPIKIKDSDGAPIRAFIIEK